jgi:hypothetical protein
VTEKKEPGLRQYEEAIETRAAFWQDLIAGRISERTKVSEDILGAPDTMVTKSDLPVASAFAI